MALQPQNFSFIPFEDEIVEAKFKTWMRQVLRETHPNPQHQSEPELPDIIGIVEAADITGYAINTIYDLIGEGKIPHLPKNGRKHLRFSRKALIKWQLEEQAYKKVKVNSRQQK